MGECSEAHCGPAERMVSFFSNRRDTHLRLWNSWPSRLSATLVSPNNFVLRKKQLQIMSGMIADEDETRAICFSPLHSHHPRSKPLSNSLAFSLSDPCSIGGRFRAAWSRVGRRQTILPLHAEA